MELTYNNDQIFFSVKCKDFSDSRNALALTNENLIELSITEELGKLTSGIISLQDKSNIYSKIFRYGMEFELSWGYQKWNPALSGADIGSSYRKGLKAILQNPSGVGSTSGVIEYHIGFYSTEILAQKTVKVYDMGTKADVVRSLFRDLGISESNMFIKLDMEERTYKLSTENFIRQDENAFAFLRELAKRWHCTMHTGNDRNGQKMGLFVQTKQYNNEYTNLFLTKQGITKNEKTLYYMNGDLSNVDNFDWQNHIGDSGQGFFIKMDYVNGTYIFQRYQAETQKIITYKLNQPRVDEYVREHAVQASALTEEIINAKNYDSRIGTKTVQYFFDKLTETTAPDGMGFTVNCERKGDPFMIPNLRIIFGDNFPSELMINKKFNVPIYFLVRKSIHTINANGYRTNSEIVDSYIQDQGFLKDTTPAQVVQ